ncbi:MAG: transposase, partial [Anaerolineales bacterium]
MATPAPPPPPATLIEHYLPALKARYAGRLLPSHLRAISAIRRCRTADAGSIQLRCPACSTQQQCPRSCGHRSCPKCQNHAATVWLDRQRAKLLPVEYFMATFTLPRELRALAWRHQSVLYGILFAAACSTLKDFGRTPRHLGAELGMSAVLHTHSRRLDFHPHVHVIIPGGGVDKLRRQWKKTKGKYLFNARALASVFRARVLAAVHEAGLTLPGAVPAKWVVHCARVGSGEPALKYLSRYLYRGVVSEKNIVAHHDGRVTF